MDLQHTRLISATCSRSDWRYGVRESQPEQCNAPETDKRVQDMLQALMDWHEGGCKDLLYQGYGTIIFDGHTVTWDCCGKGNYGMWTVIERIKKPYGQ